MLPIAATLGLVAGMFALATPSADAAGNKTCWVKNTTLAKAYGPANRSVLQTAIDKAEPGNTLEVRGRCVGNFSIDKALALVGVAKDGYPVATLDGNASGRVLSIDSGAVVTLTDLSITNGSSTYGTGISNHGTLTLNGSSSVTGNEALYDGGGIYNDGVLTLNDSSSVSGNTAAEEGGYGGGILNDHGILTLNDSSSVSGNSAGLGGGILSYVASSLTLNDSSSVSGNQADIGGGVENRTGGTFTLNGSSSVSGNGATDYGGGVANLYGAILTLNDSSSVTGNEASFAGGIYNYFGTVNFAPNWSGTACGNDPDDWAGCQP